MNYMKNKSKMTALTRILAISAVAALVLMGTAVGEVSRDELVGEWPGLGSKRFEWSHDI